MNIIKFKDIVAENPLWKDATFYNEKLRGKYAYYIHWTYVVALDDVTIEDVVGYEVDINSLLISSVRFINLHEGETGHWLYPDYIDLEETDRINSVDNLLSYNNYVPDDDITLEELKKFRTWLATSLLDLKEWDDNTTHLLNYYKGGMTDDTIKWLTEFGVIKGVSINTISSTPCGCGSSSNLSSLYNENLVAGCDPISIYRSSIKLAMVELFSNISTWSDLAPAFLQSIENYLKGIIKSNLPLVSSTNVLDIYSCKCLGDINYGQKQAQAILEDTIEAFSLIRNDDVKSNKNKIVTALNAWSSNLYEIMEW